MNFDQVARFAAGSILNSLLAGLVVALIAWIVAHWFRRYGSGVRFAVWLGALFSIVLLIAGGSSLVTSYQVSASPSANAVTLPGQVAWYLFVAWVLGAIFGLFRVGCSLYRLRRLRASCVPVDLDRLDPTLRVALDKLQIHRRVTLCESEVIRVPAAIGYAHPLVVFPGWMLNELPLADVVAILRHELAHLSRYDDWTNLAQKIVKAVFFFHPAVWFIESRLTLEREMACDDAVLASDVAPRAYAESLVNLAERSYLRRSVELAQAAIGHVQQLKLRVIKILSNSPSRNRTQRLGKAGATLLTLAALLSLAGIAHLPRLIGFAESPVSVVSAEHLASPVASAAPGQFSKPLNVSYLPKTTTAETLHRSYVRRAYHHPAIPVGTDFASLRPLMPEVTDNTMDLGQPPADRTLEPVIVVWQSNARRSSGIVVWRVVVFEVSPTQQLILLGGVPHQI